MSRQWTSWPSSAKQAAVTRPTQPAPITPMGSRSAKRRMSLQRPRRADDREHLLQRQLVRQRVGEPVGALAGLPRDEPDAVAVVVDLHLAAPDLAVLVRPRQDRRIPPGRALDAVVLADLARVHHDPVRAVLAVALAADRVRARRGLE